jgi:MraZ protein
LTHIERFKGQEDFKVDSKFRLSIPASFRRVLESQDPDWEHGKSPRVTLVYGPHLDGYVEGYSVETMAEVERALEGLPRRDPRAVAMRSNFIHHSVTLTVDDTGRIVVPVKVRERLGIAKDTMVQFLGELKTFQLLKLEDYEQKQADNAADLDEDFDSLAYLDELMAAQGAEA